MSASMHINLPTSLSHCSLSDPYYFTQITAEKMCFRYFLRKKCAIDISAEKEHNRLREREEHSQ